ncbi:MAG: aminotransferase class V-fold PLP-dependent enzyme [bacterium]
MENPYKGMITINALMRGGVVPPDVRERLASDWMEVGYITCYDCLEGRSSLVDKPRIRKFLEETAAFFGGDAAEHAFGCRGAQYAVMHTIAGLPEKNRDYCDTIIIDPNSHYTTNIAAEMNGLKVVEPPHSGYPEYSYHPEAFEEKIKEVKNREGRLPALVVLTHVDPYYGNLAPAAEVGDVCEKYEIPFMVNAAYTGGVMPVNMKQLKCDFLTLSAHKSMASLGPLGFVVTNFKWAKDIFAVSQATASWSGRAFGKKIPNVFGCAIGGVPLISSMLSFPGVRERVGNWDEELKKTNDFAAAMEEIPTVMLLGQNPHRHHLLHFETPRFWEISKTRRKKGFFLAEEMVKRGIVGLHRGMTKHIKMSVYGLTDDEIRKVRDAFHEIAGVGNEN